MPDTLDLIKQDHRKVEQLFAEFEQTKNIDIAEQICIELTVHARLEEELLYPLLDQKVDHKEAEHAEEEHDEAKRLISQIEEALSSDGDVVDLMSRLKESIHHHVQEEETEILPHMQREVGPELAKLAPTVIQRKKELMEEEGDDYMVDVTEQELKQ